MASTITAGNATNGLAIASDITGAIEIKTGTGAGTTALTLDASQGATFAGAVTSGGVVTSSTGALYPLAIGTAVASTSGTSITFTGIPATARRVTLSLRSVSTSGTSNYLVQIGTSGGIVTTGYGGSSGRIAGGAASASASTAGLLFQAIVATSIYSGAVVFTNMGSNVWAAMGVAGDSAGTNAALYSATSVSLGGVLDRIRITTVNGTDTFDAGTVNILWE